MSLVRELRVIALSIPFKSSFRHASAERAETSSVWVEARADSVIGFGESCPRSYVTGETLEDATAFINAIEPEVRHEIDSVESLRAWTATRREAIDRHPAAWCAVELALLDLLAKESGITVDALLALPRPDGPFRFSAVIGDSPPDVFAATAERFRRLGFTDYKIKLSADNAGDRQKLAVLAGWGMEPLRVRVDANNLFATVDDALASLRSLPVPLFAVEEPIAAGRYNDLSRIGVELGCRIVLDESLLRVDQIPTLPPPQDRWIVNVRVSKMGGLLRALDVVRRARAAGHGVIVGAQVGETSLLTRAALTAATAAGPALVAQEGAFGTHLLAHDICDPPLMFGAAGVLEPTGWINEAGFGLPIAPQT